MAKNSLLSTTEPKTQKQSKQTTRTGIESQKDGDHMQGYQLGEGGERMGEEVQRISIIGRYKINGGRSKMV